MVKASDVFELSERTSGESESSIRGGGFLLGLAFQDIPCPVWLRPFVCLPSTPHSLRAFAKFLSKASGVDSGMVLQLDNVRFILRRGIIIAIGRSFKQVLGQKTILVGYFFEESF